MKPQIPCTFSGRFYGSAINYIGRRAPPGTNPSGIAAFGFCAEMNPVCMGE